MIDLSQRATEVEQLDVGVPDDEARRSLADIRLVNRWLGGRRALLRVVRPFLEASTRPTLLDVGCGSADLPALLGRVIGPSLVAVGLDLKLLHVREAPPNVRAVVGDVACLPFAERSFDVVTASLFLHHFDEDRAPRVLSDLFALCKRALVVNDLRRHAIPYSFGRATFPLIFRSQVSVDDGLLSIRRAFTAGEMRRAFERAGLPSVRIRCFFPYRLVAVAERQP